VSPLFHILSGGASLVALVLMILQFVFPRGTKNHIRRACAAGLIVLGVIIGNTWYVSSVRGLRWDIPFFVHTGFGILFFVAYLLTLYFGHQSLRNKASSVRHGSMGALATLILVVSLIFGFLAPFFR